MSKLTSSIALPELLRLLPKAELHTHIDGCLRAETIVAFAKKAGMSLPSYDAVELSRILYRERYENLVDLLKVFDLSLAVMKTPEALEQIAYEFVQDQVAEGVYYLEGRFAPQLHVGFSLHTIEEVIITINKGMKKAAEEYNSSPEVVNKQKPRFQYGIICCVMRSIFKGTSPYFDRLIDSFNYSGKKGAEVQAGIELVHAAIDARDKLGVPIVAIDLAGGEKHNPPEDFKPAFDLARKNLFAVTIHAGEAESAESIFGAITVLGAERIGHGLHLFNAELVKRENPEKFCSDLAQYIARRGIAIEVCMTSNIQTMPELKRIADHPSKKMIDNGLTVSFATDNTFLTKSTLSHEIELAIREVGISMEDAKKSIFNGFEKSFFFGTIAQKKEYLDEIKKYYESVEAKYCH